MVREASRLLKELPAKDWWGRQRIISALVARPGTEYVFYLEEGIRNHEDADVRNAAMEVYRALGKRALPSLSSLILDPDPEVRLFTVNILCEIRDRSSLSMLVGALRDPDVNVRCAAAEALGGCGEGALGALGKAMDDEPWVAMAAVNSLGGIGGEAALKMLYACLEKRTYPEVAILAIAKAGGKDSIRHLAACISEPRLREQALKAIIGIAEREGVRPNPEYFLGMVPLLVAMLGSKDEETKRFAFMALSWSADMSALPFLLEGMKDEELQEYAIEGMLLVGRKAVCAIVDEMKGSCGAHRPVLAKLLSMIGEPMALLQFARDEDPEVRTEAALALGSLRLERARLILNEMLGDDYEEVRLAAGRSLSRLGIDG